MGSTPPVHLLVKSRVACGTPSWQRASHDHRLTTCERCARTIHMADCEAKAMLPPQRFSR